MKERECATTKSENASKCYSVNPIKSASINRLEYQYILASRGSSECMGIKNLSRRFSLVKIQTVSVILFCSIFRFI